MIVRVVKMHFRPDQTDRFLFILHENIDKIRQFPGCIQVQVLRDTTDPALFMTYSHWESEEDLQRYRRSELFLSVWTRTKQLFDRRPEAWSLEDIDHLISKP